MDSSISHCDAGLGSTPEPYKLYGSVQELYSGLARHDTTFATEVVLLTRKLEQEYTMDNLTEYLSRWSRATARTTCTGRRCQSKESSRTGTRSSKGRGRSSRLVMAHGVRMMRAGRTRWKPMPLDSRVLAKAKDVERDPKELGKAWTFLTKIAVQRS